MHLMRKKSLESCRTHLSQSFPDPSHVHSRSSYMAKNRFLKIILPKIHLFQAKNSIKRYQIAQNHQKSSILMISKFPSKYCKKVVPIRLVYPFLTLDRPQNRLQIDFLIKSKKVSLFTFFVHSYTDAMQNILCPIYSQRVVYRSNQVQSRLEWLKQMTFHYYDIVIRPIDPEIEIDFDTHEF